MKKALLALIWMGIATAVPFSAKAEGKLQNFRLTLCSKDGQKCMEIQGFEAKQSFLAPIFGFKDSQVRVLDHKTGKEKVFSQARGHIDFASEQIVLLEKHEGQLLERTFTLATLNETNFQVN